jgi:hypothetical protein
MAVLFFYTSYSSRLDISNALNFHECWNTAQQLTVFVRVEEGRCKPSQTNRNEVMIEKEGK